MTKRRSATMKRQPRAKASTVLALIAAALVVLAWAGQDIRALFIDTIETSPAAGAPPTITRAQAETMLAELTVAGPASGADYDREAQFRDEWPVVGDCDLRDAILTRDLTLTRSAPGIPCLITDGVLIDPYTGNRVTYERGVNDRAVQIDDVVSLYNAWTTGAQDWDQATREAFATDPINLLAVDGPTNETKRHHDASEWIPANPAYHCAFATTQISVKHRYGLWVSPAEKSSLASLLATCAQRTEGAIVRAAYVRLALTTSAGLEARQRLHAITPIAR